MSARRDVGMGLAGSGGMVLCLVYMLMGVYRPLKSTRPSSTHKASVRGDAGHVLA